MSRIPSGLLYLAIYNPTLHPKQPFDDDDEDAEEQAHILFYTSKERAVSRDRMLRQIGLAKALVNFSELFNPNDKCESIHSQSRRMVLVSPEPNFWINAAVDLPKNLQTSTPSKGSGSKGKPKATTKNQPEAPEVYEFEDGTVHDVALRSRLMHAYERFKLLHGSFTSVLAELGQEALELQLERFFTVWAWSWNLEVRPQIAEQLGLPLQPYYNSVISLLDGYSATLPETVVPVILSRSHIIPSHRYVSKEYPSALAEHLMTLIPPPTAHEDEQLASSMDTIQAFGTDVKSNSTGLFGLPAVNMNMDVRKWNWQGYLTFGKGGPSSSKSDSASPTEPEEQKENGITEPQAPRNASEMEREESPMSPPRSTLEVEVDSKALEEALSSEEGLSSHVQTEVEKELEQVNDQPHYSDTEPVNIKRSSYLDDDRRPLLVDGSSSPQSSMTILPRPPNRAPSSRSPSPTFAPTFSTCQIRLSLSDDIFMTQKRDVHYYIRKGMMIGLLGADELDSPEADEILSTAQQASELLDDVDLTLQNAALSNLSESLPSANKILQMPDQYTISTDQYTLQSSGIASDSSHLQNAAALLERDPDILEVFTRGQNPQYWHVAKRGLGSYDSPSSEDPSTLRGRAYLEVFKKESSLPDVDNVLAGILRRSGIAESGLV